MKPKIKKRTLRELKNIIDLARKKGALVIKVDDIEITFLPDTKQKPIEMKNISDLVPELNQQKELDKKSLEEIEADELFDDGLN